MSAGATSPHPQCEARVELGPDELGRVLELVGDGAILVDLATRAILKANERFFSLTRFEPADLPDLDLVRLHSLADMERIMQHARRPDPSGETLRGLSVTGGGGALFAADVRVIPLAHGESALVLLIYHALAQDATHDGGTGGAAPAEPAPHPSLPAFTRRLASVRDRDDLCRALVEASSALIGSDQVLLVARRGAKPGTEVIGSFGLPAAAQEAAACWLDQMVSGGQLSPEKPRVIEALSEQEGLRTEGGCLPGSRTRALVIFPLESDGRLLGAWALGHSQAGAAESCDLALGRVLAAHIAGSVAGVLLLEQTRREKSHHEMLNRIISWLRGPLGLDEILHSITAELCKSLKADRCLILLPEERGDDPKTPLRIEAEYHEPQRQPLKPRGVIPFGSTSLGAAALFSSQPLAVEDLAARADLTDEGEESARRFDLRGFIMAKVVSRQEFIGLVAVGRSDQAVRWTADEIELVRAVADHVAVTIETGRLAHASRERADQIERERREWERTFDAIPDMLSIHDGYGRMLRANVAMKARLGGDPGAFKGRTCDEILEVIMGRWSGCPHEEALRLRRAITREFQGELGVFALTAIPCFDPSGACLYIIHNCKEITEEKQIREQLLQTEKMAAVGNLVSGVAHELNNPLTGVIGFAELLLEKETDPKRKTTLARIHDEGERASRIVRNLLTFARKHKPESSMVDIGLVLEKTLELRAYELRVNKINVETDLTRDLPRTLADPNQLLQVFMNILTNAEQAMREARGKGNLRISSTVAGGRIRLIFKDDGPGIPPDNLKKVFDPFFTTKPTGKGTGLGLSICHGIIKEHGGTIGASSTVGQGTTFTIELPIVTGPESPSEEGRPAEGPRAPASAILVVDDELSIREMVRDALERRGHRVDVVESCQAALEAVRSKPYAAIVSDLRMPEMDGQDLFARLTEERPDAARRILFTSGDTASLETRSFFEASGRPYILKPFKLTHLIDAVERIILAGPAPDGGTRG